MNISIAGDLGSGKSSVAKKICEKLGFDYFSTGSIQRKLAEEKGMDTLELNRFSETTREIDDYIDSFLKNINQSKKNHVLDSRLAWHFVDQSFKIYLTVLPEIAASRVLSDTERKNEPGANTVKDRKRTLLERKESENRRFKNMYHVDCLDFNNYDRVIDTSYVSIDEVVDFILCSIESQTEEKKGDHRFWCSPKSLYPTQTMEIKNKGEKVDFPFTNPIEIVKYDGLSYIKNGHEHVSDAIFNAIPFVPVHIVAEDNHCVAENQTVKDFVKSTFDLARLQSWEKIHGFQYVVYPCFE